MSKGGQGKASELPERTEWIWYDGEIIPWEDAQLHVMSHVVHYGSSVFEGIRFYDTPDGAAAFRLTDHIKRFANSAKIYRMELGGTVDELADACREVVIRNGLDSGYLRPVAVRGLGALGLHPGKSPVETYVVCWPWGQYLGAEALAQGVDVCVSSWSRPAPNTLPTLAKAGGACRDLAVLEMEAIRAAGLPARFVSGYRAGDPETNNQELHAWVEVYLPGAGWRGYDPTTGFAVSDGHVALAAGSDPRIVAPTSGSFRGTGVVSSIWTSIDMRIIES